MYQYYGDLFRELRELSQIHVYQGVINNISSLAPQLEKEVDCVIFGLGYFAQSNQMFYNKIIGLDELSIPVVCMIHKPQTMLEQKLEFCKINNIDLIVDSQFTYKQFEEIAGIKTIRLPFTATPKYYHERDVPKIYDIGFCGALHGEGKIKGPTANLRQRIYKKLEETDLDVYWNAGNTLDYRISSVEEYASKINQCKVWLATTGPTLDVSPRYFEVMLSKTLLMCNKMSEQYGEYFTDGVNCVMFDNDLSDFNEKLSFYLENDSERERIIENAYETAFNNYTWKHMAALLLEQILILKRGYSVVSDNS
jgi:hypothetical protein